MTTQPNGTGNESWLDLPHTHTHTGHAHAHTKARARAQRCPESAASQCTEGAWFPPYSSRPAELSEIAALLTVPIKKTGGGRHGRPSATAASPDTGSDLNAVLYRHCEATSTSPGSTAGLSGTAYELLIITVMWLTLCTADSSDRTVPHSRYRRKNTPPLPLPPPSLFSLPRMHAASFLTLHARS